MTDYEKGHDEGYRDGLIICSPINTNGHTFSEYLRIKSWYESSIFTLNPTDWQRGYGDGLDKAAVEAGYPKDALDV